MKILAISALLLTRLIVPEVSVELPEIAPEVELSLPSSGEPLMKIDKLSENLMQSMKRARACRSSF
jgi:hypothetical protein